MIYHQYKYQYHFFFINHISKNLKFHNFDLLTIFLKISNFKILKVSNNLSLNLSFHQNITNMIPKTYLQSIFEFVLLFLKILENLEISYFFDIFLTLSGIRRHSKHEQIWIPLILKWSVQSNLKIWATKSFHLHCMKSYHWKCDIKNTKLRRPWFYNFHPRWPWKSF